MSEHQWVEGPALDIIKAMREIKPGDEVRLDLVTHDRFGMDPKYHGAVARVTDRYRWNIYGTSYIIALNDYYVTDLQIGAWRRPCPTDG